MKIGRTKYIIAQLFLVLSFFLIFLTENAFGFGSYHLSSSNEKSNSLEIENFSRARGKFPRVVDDGQIHLYLTNFNEFETLGKIGMQIVFYRRRDFDAPHSIHHLITVENAKQLGKAIQAIALLESEKAGTIKRISRLEIWLHPAGVDGEIRGINFAEEALNEDTLPLLGEVADAFAKDAVINIKTCKLASNKKSLAFLAKLAAKLLWQNGGTVVAPAYVVGPKFNFLAGSFEAESSPFWQKLDKKYGTFYYRAIEEEKKASEKKSR